jgi:uncharacterized protein (TIGR03086 family)
MDPKELFAKAVEQATACIRNVRDDELSNSTPCTEWDLRTLLNHMVYETLWVPELLRGKTIAEVGDRFDGDVLGADPVSNWQRSADAALIAVKQADPDMTVHLSYGDFPARHYIAEMASDILIHGWDVGQSLQCSIMFDPAVAKAVYDQLAPNIQGYRGGGFMGEPIDVPTYADIQTKLLAMAGRRGRTA